MRLLIGSDYHGSEDLINKTLDHLSDPSVDGFIYLGDFCDYAGYNSQNYGGCNPRGLQELQQLKEFLTAVDFCEKPWLMIPGNHEPTAEHLKFDLINGQVLTSLDYFEWLGFKVLAVPYQIAMGRLKPVALSKGIQPTWGLQPPVNWSFLELEYSVEWSRC